MAKATITASDLGELTETDIADAIGNTEQEIFDEATGADPAENDGDRSLEAMDDDIPGAEDGDETDEAEGEESNPADLEADLEAQGDDDADARGQEEQPQPQRGIPSARLKQEADARRLAEAESRARDAENRELRARLEAVERTQKAPDKQDKPAKPDMFADPEGYEKWVLDQAEQRAATRFEQRQAERDQERVNSSLAEAARGPRSFEFQAAYGKLSSLDPRDPQAQRQVRAIVNAPDPAKALFDWWDENGGEDFRESVRAQLIPNYRPQRQQGRAAPQRTAPDAEAERVFRLPKSLNGATGGGTHRNADPDLYDDSEGAVFRYATR
jgi:hypothetical protein